jgi:hypothetical protein
MLGLLVIALDALVLMVLLKAVSDEEVDFRTAAIIAVVAAIGTFALAFGLGILMGIAGVILAAIIAACALGVAVSAMFGTEIKRSFVIGILFMVCHVGIVLGFQMLTGK